MGSSSSFTVGVLHNLHAILNQYVTKEQLASGACEIEIDILKEPIGKQDQYAAAYGGLNVIYFNPDGTVTVEPLYISNDIYNQLQKNLVMFYMGSQKKASDILSDQKKNVSLKGISYGLKKRFKIISFNDNMPAFSAIANDLSYDEVFVEQLKSYVCKHDLVIGISGSGNSVNVLKAIEYAKSLDVKTIGLCGFKGGKLKEAVEYPVHIHINDMEVTEDVHMLIFHTMKQAIISELKGDSASMGKTYDERVKDQ